MFSKTILILGFFWTVFSFAQEKTVLIPTPSQIEHKNTYFKLNERVPIIVNSEKLKGLAAYFRQEVLKNTGVTLNNRKQKSSSQPTILLEINNKNTLKEYYTLDIDKNNIHITASHQHGLFNGITSLLQLILGADTKNENIILKGVSIKDKPKYVWRGLMLDVSRHFIPKEKVKNLIDWMAFYKLNRLHLHLTDEPAWRIEIKQYPKLALIGGIGNYNNPLAPAQFYSQEEIKEIVSYATKRFIQVIPEIDMPGHATAANRAYPEYSGGGSKKHPEFTFNPGKQETYEYLTNILEETNVLFPSNMLHLGGDEVSYGNHKWTTNPEIKALMKKHNLRDLKDVEHYFMKRMADSVYNMGATLLVWDEMASIDLNREKTYIFWWRQDKPEQLHKALKKGYKTILCPRLPLYFDFVQDESHQSGRRWGGDYNTLKDVYSFSAKNYIKNKEYANQILGIQANLWTETVTTEKRVDFLLFPRISALAEAAWSTQPDDFEHFKKKVKKHFPFYKKATIYFFNPFDKKKTPEPLAIK